MGAAENDLIISISLHCGTSSLRTAICTPTLQAPRDARNAGMHVATGDGFGKEGLQQMTHRHTRQSATPGESAGRGTPAGGSSSKRSSRWLTRAEWSRQAVYLLLLMAAAEVAQWLIEGPAAQSVSFQAAIWIAVVVICAIGVFLAHRELYGYFASAKAGIVLLTAILFMTILGTVILQRPGGVIFRQRYGSFAAPLQALHLDDVFHSYPFALLLFLVMLTSIITVLRRRRTMLRWRNIGLLLTHVSVVAILIGAMIGSGWGRKGMLHLEIGQVASDFVVDRGRGIERGAQIELPFAVRLDDFELEHYDPEFKLYTYRLVADGYRLASAQEPVEGESAGEPGPGSDVEVTVRRVFEHARSLDDWVSAPPSTPNDQVASAAHIRVEREDRTITEGWIARPMTDTARLQVPGSPTEIRFAWKSPGTDWISTLAAGDGASELRIETEAGNIAIEPGGIYTLNDGRVVAVESFLPDFSIDTQNHEAFSRSDRPNNPALVVRVGDGGPPAKDVKPSYLFARADMREMMQGMGHRGGKELVFQYDPDAAQVERSIVIVGKTGEWIDVSGGKVRSRGAIAWGEPFSMAEDKAVRMTVDQPLERAIARRGWVEAAEGPEHRAVEVEVRRGADSMMTMLFADEGDPLRLTSDRLLVYRENPDDVRNYKSTVTILDGDSPVLTRLMEVNHPLSYAGYSLYQSNYDPDNPKYSGLEVVYDPGLPIVYFFFWVLMYGVLHTVALRNWLPWWERSESRTRDSARVQRIAKQHKDVEVSV